MKLPSWIRAMIGFGVDKDETMKKIAQHIELTHKASKALDKAIAALDGETDWWSCKENESRKKDCPYDHP